MSIERVHNFSVSHTGIFINTKNNNKLQHQPDDKSLINKIFNHLQATEHRENKDQLSKTKMCSMSVLFFKHF